MIWLTGLPNRDTGAVMMTSGAKGDAHAMEIISAINREYNKISDQRNVVIMGIYPVSSAVLA
jgi:hypothetical protein